MILAPLLAHRAPEALLLSFDAFLYWIAALCISHLQDAAAAVIVSLAAFVTINSHRHISASRAACNEDATSEGQLRLLPAALTDKDTKARPQTLWPWLPVFALIIAATMSVANGQSSPTGTLIAFVAAEAHFIVSRVHGDCRGGKPAPTLFVLMLHVAASISGTPAAVTLSLHRLLICWTYFLTGFRKLYCTGPRWCDGKNLQLMLCIQGLYHDPSEMTGLNFILARRRWLCCISSVAVVGLQLILPLALVLDDPIARHAGFALAMSFHASNHILWRINFFVAWCPCLLALITEGDQLPLGSIATSGASTVAPASVLAIYLTLQLGHACDLATEKLLARTRRMLSTSASTATRSSSITAICALGLTRLVESVIWLVEMHLLGDYYSSYWPESHPLRGEPVVCALCVAPDGRPTRLLPAVADFYWRRDMSSGVKWARVRGEACEVRQWSGWSDAKGNVGALQVARGAFAVNATISNVQRPLDEVVRALAQQLESTFLGAAAMRRMRSHGGGDTVLRARVLEADVAEDCYRVRTLWEWPLEVGKARA